MHDVRVFVQHKETLYRLIQDDEGRVAYRRADQSEVRKADVVGTLPESAVLVGVMAASRR
jgi:hypothetical protein